MGQKHIYTMKELEIQTISVNKLTRELLQFTVSETEYPQSATKGKVTY